MQTEQITFEFVQGLEHLPEAYRIREEVFIREQGFVHEVDETDRTAWHLLLRADGVPAATGRIFPEEGDAACMHVGRVAVLPAYRGRGMGSRVMRELERRAALMGAKRTVLSAQVRARGFYESLGYRAHGGEYLDEYCPHVRMEKPLER